MATVTLHRLTVSYRDGRTFRDHFASQSEAELSERAAWITGAATMLHVVEVPMDAARLAGWLDDYCREQVTA
jgi:hypothetical protein